MAEGCCCVMQWMPPPRGEEFPGVNTDRAASGAGIGGNAEGVPVHGVVETAGDDVVCDGRRQALKRRLPRVGPVLARRRVGCSIMVASTP